MLHAVHYVDGVFLLGGEIFVLVRRASGFSRHEGGSARQRDVQLFYRGTLGSSREAQELRIRLPQLRQIAGAQISLVDAETLEARGTQP